MTPKVIIVENVYDQPHSIASEARSARFDKVGYFPGKAAQSDLHVQHVTIKSQQATDQFLIPAKDSGQFRLTPISAFGSRHIHYDGFTWSAVIGLNENTIGALSFWRHRATGLTKVPETREDIEGLGFNSLAAMEEELIKKQGLDENLWELTVRIPLRFNDLVLFDGKFWHSPYVSQVAQEQRLTQHFFFSAI